MFFGNAQGSTMLINQKMKDLALPILKEKVFMHDYVIYILSEIFGVRIYINEALMKYRIHECNQVGVTKKIFTIE